MIEIAVVDGVTPALVQMTDRMADFTQPLKEILADAMFAAQEQIVEGKGAMHGGTPWAPMAASTVRRGRDPATLLVETGGLLLSMSPGGAGGFLEAGPTEGSAGTDLFYAGFQQWGTRMAPARPFLWWPEDHLPLYEKQIGDWIMSEAAGSA